MEVDRLRKLIREEIHKAFQEEVRDILVEAVQIASKPDLKEELRVQTGVKSDFSGYGNLTTLLEDTARTMSKEDYHDILGSPSVVQSEQPEMVSESCVEGFEDCGVDALPDFAKRAGEIFKKSMTIRKNAV